MRLPIIIALMSPTLMTMANANNHELDATCVNNLLLNGQASMTLADVRQVCNKQQTESAIIRKAISQRAKTLHQRDGNISKRIKSEKKTEFEPYVLTPHKMNYLLPAITTTAINKEAYRSLDGYEENLEDVESKFQLSLKVPLNSNSIFVEGDGLYIGFTLQAWWQIYASGISKPFRETNYQPEIFYVAPLDWQIFGGNTALILGMEHQSNGRGQGLSRSWNRVYTHFLFEKDNFAMSIKPWVRLSEDDKEFEFDPNGDDNPDIDDYMGNFELGMVYQWNDVELSFKGRQNFDTNYGAAEFGLTFPMWGKLRGYATAFNGYGESLIDYNYSQTRFGIGISLNNIL